jgi:hypothetical protein
MNMNAPSIALRPSSHAMAATAQQVVVKNNDWMLYAALFFCSAPPVVGFAWIIIKFFSCFV